MTETSQPNQLSDPARVETTEPDSSDPETSKRIATIILQRHGQYDKNFPKGGVDNPTEEEKATLGRMTPEGIAETREVARGRIAEFLKEGGDKIDFAVIASPTFWLDQPEFGQRAIETGQIISEEISRQLEEAGLPADQLLNLSESIKGDKVRPSDKIVESQMFSDNLEFVNTLRQKYGGQGREFWDAYNADVNREERKAAGAEGSPEAADRVNMLMNTLTRAAHIRHSQHPDRQTVVFVVSHHEAIEPYAMHVLGTQKGEFEPTYNDAIIISVDPEGNGHTTIAEREIEVPFAKHGKPETVDQ